MKRVFERDYFEQITTPDKAYWLGFIAADGYIGCGRDAVVSIGLKVSDIGHLEKFAKDIRYDGTIRKINKTKACRIDLYSKKMAGDLIAVGMDSTKGKTLQPWKGPDHLMLHYWRGFFDGDGCITYHVRKRNYKQWTTSLIGTNKMCDGFIEFVNLPNKPWKTYKSGLKVIQWSSIRPCQHIARLLYSIEGPFLDRKYALAQEMLAQTVRENRIQVSTNKDMLVELFDQHGSWENVASHLGFSRNGMYKHIRKLGITRRKWNHKSDAA